MRFPLLAAWRVTLVPATATAAIPIAVTVVPLRDALAVAMRMPIPRRSRRVFALNHSRMASAPRLRVRASVAIKAEVNLRPARVSAAFRARVAIAAVPIAIVVVCLREAAAAVPVVDAAGHVLLKTTGSIRVSSTPASAPWRCLRGCGSSAPESTPETPVATKTTTRKSSKKTETVDEDEDTDEATDESTDSDATKTAKKEENEVTKVKVSVAKGKTAWIEVKVDGKSVYGAQATGPFEQEYTPESSIEITTSKPSDVTVTKNGEKVRYDTKTSGVARVTITVPKKETTDSANGESSDGTDTTDGTDTSDGTDAQSTDGAVTATDGQTPTDSTDYSYDSY